MEEIIHSHKKIYWIFGSCCVISILISICAIAIATSRVGKTEFDPNGFYGWTVAVLSFLVTILIGWQIFNYLSFQQYLNSKIKETTRTISENVREFVLGIQDYSKAYTLSNNFAINIVCLWEFSEIYILYTSSIVHFLKFKGDSSSNLDDCMSGINKVLDCIDDVVDEYLKFPKVDMYRDNIVNFNLDIDDRFLILKAMILISDNQNVIDNYNKAEIRRKKINDIRNKIIAENINRMFVV